MESRLNKVEIKVDEHLFDGICKELVEYWTSNGLTLKDFYCRECGKCLIDKSLLLEGKFIFHPAYINDKGFPINPCFTRVNEKNWKE